MVERQQDLNTYPPELRFGEYKFVKFLAKGGEGHVCLYTRVKDNTPVAVKFDGTGQNQILNECLFMRNNCDGYKLPCAPKYDQHNVQGGRRHLIMQYLEKDLEDFICEFPKGKIRDGEI